MKAGIWILVVFVGSLPVAAALQYYFTGEANRNTPSRNWLAVAQAVFGIGIMAFGLYRQIKASRQVPEPDEPEGIRLSDDR